jgi:hypothetical protein
MRYERRKQFRKTSRGFISVEQDTLIIDNRPGWPVHTYLSGTCSVPSVSPKASPTLSPYVCLDSPNMSGHKKGHPAGSPRPALYVQTVRAPPSPAHMWRSFGAVGTILRTPLAHQDPTSTHFLSFFSLSSLSFLSLFSLSFLSRRTYGISHWVAHFCGQMGDVRGHVRTCTRTYGGGHLMHALGDALRAASKKSTGINLANYLL